MAASAIVMSMEMDQTIAPAASAACHPESGKPSFAQSFDERLAHAMNVEAPMGAKLNQQETPSSAGETRADISEGPSATAGMKRHGDSRIAALENGGGKNVIAGSSFAATDEAGKIAGIAAKTDAVMARHGASEEIASGANDVNAGEGKPTIDATPEIAPDTPAADKDLSSYSADGVADVLVRGTGQSVAAIDREGIAPRKDIVETASKEAEASAKKTKKPEAAKEPDALKSMATSNHAGAAIGAVPSPIMTAVQQGAAPVQVSVPMPSGSPVVVAAVPGCDSGKSTTVAQSAGTKPATAHGKSGSVTSSMAGSMAANGGKTSVSGGPTAPTMSTTPESEKSNAGDAKGNASAAVAGADGAKLNAAPTGQAHVPGNGGLAAGVSAAAGVAASLHLTGDASSAKLQGTGANVGSIAAHATGEQSASGTPMLSSTDAVHRTLVATPKILEVGIANGTQGWVKVRAELGGDGAVNASLSTVSQAGQEMLRRELPSLTAYLQQERVAVNTVVVHATAGAEPRAASGMNGGASGQMQQHNGASAGERGGPDGMAAGMIAHSGVEAALADEALSPVRYAGVGGWLSVRA